MSWGQLVTFWEDFHRRLMALVLCLAGITMATSRLPSTLWSLPTSAAECQPSLGNAEAAGVLRDPPVGLRPEGGSPRIVAKQNPQGSSLNPCLTAFPPECLSEIKLISSHWRRAITCGSAGASGAVSARWFPPGACFSWRDPSSRNTLWEVSSPTC